MKISRDGDLFIQVPYRYVAPYLWAICLAKVSIEVFTSQRTLDSYRAEDVERIRARLDRCGIVRHVHGPISDPFEVGFLAYKDSWDKAVAFSGQLKARAIVMHAEYSRRKFPAMEEWAKDVVPLVKDIVKDARAKGIAVLLENHYEHTPDAVLAILREVRSDNLRACFDVGHFHAFGEKGPLEFLGDYPLGSIAEVHLSDNKKDGDSHLALGEGTVDFHRVFDALAARGDVETYVIEARDLWGAVKGIRHLRRIGKIAP